jgi:hypothetical protein
MAGEIRYTCVDKGCGLNTTPGTPYCPAHQAVGLLGTQTQTAQSLEKGIDRSPVESDAIHLLKQAVRRLENGDKEAAKRYMVCACVIFDVQVRLDP